MFVEVVVTLYCGEFFEEKGIFLGYGGGEALAFFGGGEAGIADAGVAGDLGPVAG